jgi:lysophospholipase L1-like esterase
MAAMRCLIGACAAAWVVSVAAIEPPEQPISVHLAGDSTMAPKRPNRRPETGWGEAFQGWFDASEVIVVNHARNGRSTRRFIEEGLWADLLAWLASGDFVFIQFGHNDQAENKPDRYTPPAQFTANLVRMVAEVREREATPVLLTPVARRCYDDAGEVCDTHGVYPSLVREVAREQGVTLLDVQADSTALLGLYGPEPSKDLYLWVGPAHPNYPEGVEDNTHFAPMGAAAMAQLVAREVANSNLDLPVRVTPSRHIIETDAEVVGEQPGPHRGGGETTGYNFFAGANDLAWNFRKRELHPGSAIGYHLHDKDEIYYVLSGQGDFTMNGEVTRVGPGTALLTRVGDSHGLRQVGDEDLVILIAYPRNP